MVKPDRAARKQGIMGRSLEEIRRLRERISAGTLSEPAAEAERLTIKSRIVGVLLQDARRYATRSTKESAGLLGIPETDYLAFEEGTTSPSLPQLEILAYFFNVPIQHLLYGDTLALERNEDEVRSRAADVLMLRQRVIGVRLQQLREEGARTVEQVAEESGLPVETVLAVESGQTALPLNELEKLIQANRANLNDLMDGHGPVGRFVQAQLEFEEFAELPPEMRDFILRPINRTYLDLAMRLSTMEVGRLRSIAESILEITY
jgi:transcriptional regulator with XRE-family HTH domain